MSGQPPIPPASPYPVLSPGAPYGYPPPPQPAPRSRHSAGGWAAVGFSVLCIALSAWVGVSTALMPTPAQPTFHAADELDAPPDPEASAEEWNRWARRAVDVMVGQQGLALVAGDEEAFLAAVDPARARLRDELERRFDVLSQMGVGQWSEGIRGRPEVTGELAWHADVELSYCLGEQNCRPSRLVFGTDWQFVDGRLVLTDVAQTSASQGGPRPWETGDVVVASGRRAVVVASAKLRHRLDETLDQAEQAAAVADSLAGPAGPPSRYVLYLADAPAIVTAKDLVECSGLPATDWTTWFGEKPCWSGGMYVDDTDNEVIVNAGQELIQDTVTHEFTHAATLGGDDHSSADMVWWLVEGIAEYATMVGRPIDDYVGDGLRAYIRDTWEGCAQAHAPVCPPPYTVDDPALVNGPYGVAFLAVRHLADSYGLDSVRRFFAAVVLDSDPLEASSQDAFDTPWSEILTECETFIRYA